VKTRPGYNLHLTLDVELQEQVEQALGEAEGSVVVLAVETGEVLALASRPTFDPNLFAISIKPNEWRTLVEDPLRPLTNRALRGQYPPGSTFKPFMALAALEEGIITPETQFNCQGGLPFGGRTFHCWKRPGHGWVDLKQALAQSCDVYFYKVGLRLGIQNIAQHARRFWLGQDLKLQLEAASGVIPDVEWKRRRFNAPWYEGETLSVVIGQSYVLTTPIQMAVATAALANGGVVYRPFFVTQVSDADGESIQTYSPEVVTRIDIPEEHLHIVRDGMREVVHGERGTGKKAFLPSVEVAGKTGTSQVVSRIHDEEEEVPRHHRDHAWFIAFAPVQNPQIAVACLIEHAGKGGGAAAAPVVRQVLEAYFRIVEQRNLENDGIRQTAG
jgi:penicillin-binding protein 2